MENQRKQKLKINEFKFRNKLKNNLKNIINQNEFPNKNMTKIKIKNQPITYLILNK